MWVDERGVCHTVALPDPTELMSSVFRQSLDQLMVRDRRELDEVIENEQILFFEESAGLLVADSDDSDFVEATPPVQILSESVTTVTELRRLIGGIDPRWRLDALMALDDYCS